MILTIQDPSSNDSYNITLAFRHITKLGKRARLHQYAGSDASFRIKAVTTCVIVAGGPRFRTGDGSPLTAIDNALCSDDDNFSVAEGRARSLLKLLDHCGALRNSRVDIWEAYHRKFGGVEDCPTCEGKGWMMREGHDGESCPDCENDLVIGGTGLKGGVLLVLPVNGETRAGWKLLLPPRPAPVRKPAPDATVIAARIASGEAKRASRQVSRGAS